jgi:hypothetical protein
MNKEEELYAAFALYLIGMEVANADRDIDNAEFRTIFSTAERASEICFSGFVRRVADLLAGAIDQKPQSLPLTELIKTYDSNHQDVFWRVRRHLETLPQEDYMRYLLTGMLIAKQVSTVSSNRQPGLQARGRYGAATLHLGLLAPQAVMSLDAVSAWNTTNGYGTADSDRT